MSRFSRIFKCCQKNYKWNDKNGNNEVKFFLNINFLSKRIMHISEENRHMCSRNYSLCNLTELLACLNYSQKNG